ncbi:MAG: family 43 glycosylhydrolase [Sedimentisphaerales bacterium]|nr:family 43 glycosylhydrolase [Sedimentisphaerales bacterium]MBN2842846.1 family 43 glycosylhydrolase [Sedimentisphaerales bacterium]
MSLLILSFCSSACFAAQNSISAQSSDEQVYIFTSFRDSGDGLHLSWSQDGLNWVDIAGTLIEPEVGSKLMRDPHLLYGPDNMFHLVWTTGWHDKGIGYAQSKDLLNWSAQKYIPLFEDKPAHNCWAPETVYDPSSKEYMIVWSSAIDGAFKETESKDRMNNRAWYVITQNFETFSKPEVLFDPGFDNIDSTIIKDGGRYILTLKEGDQQNKGIWGPIHQAVSENLRGPYSLLSKPVIADRAEGPTLAKIGDKWTMYFDYYVHGRYGACQTGDFTTWTDISANLKTVKGQRHGSVLSIAKSTLDRLLAGLSQRKAKEEIMPPACVLPGYHADPHIAVFGDTYYIYPTTDGNEGWNTSSFSCMSSKDLIHWQNHGVILQLGKDITWTDKNAWAPAIATANGKYYFYFSAFSNIGVVVSDSPYGPFTDPLGKPLVARGSYNCQVIDPMVFVDDDGSAYLYFGQGNCNVAKLNPDMVSFDSATVKTITPVDGSGKKSYNEGAFMLKRQGKYYLMWSEFDTRDPRYSVCYAVADSPVGPFVKAANNPVLKAKGLVLGAGHHSVVQTPGTDNWYIAYHRFAIPNGTGYKRETCISLMYFNEDGSIKPVDVYEGVK